MSASSTHDAKRGEDSRARLNVLSEIPALWDQQVKLWMRINSSARTTVQDDWAPDRSDEYIYYQALLGAWPAGEDCASSEFVERMRQYVSKATKEKKIHTSWITPSAEYDAAVAEFVERTLMGTRAKPFLAQFLPFQRRVAELGMVNSLSQLTVKIASPGVPDFYQGSDLWDLNLVDPDNRRPVDFTLRSRMLGEISSKLNEGSPCCAKQAVATELLSRWSDGGVKLYVMSQALRLRRRKAELFLFGEYKPLPSFGASAANVMAFARVANDDSMVAIVPRLVTGLTRFEGGLPLGSVWGDTELELSSLPGHGWLNVFTGQKVAAGPAGRVRLAEVFDQFPVALLVKGEEQ